MFGALYRSAKSLWRNRLARSAVNRKVGGSSPPRDGAIYFAHQNVYVKHMRVYEDMLVYELLSN